MRISDWSSDVCSSDLIAPLALLLPAAGGANEAPASRAERPQGIGATFQAPVQHQVRIEQRVVLRISPRSTSARQNLLAEQPRQLPAQEYEEKKIGKCLPLRSIHAVQNGIGNKLLFY